MPEYPENPDFASRGRHAQQRGSGGPTGQPPQGPRRAPQPQQQPQQQPPRRSPQPQQPQPQPQPPRRAPQPQPQPQPPRRAPQPQQPQQQPPRYPSGQPQQARRPQPAAQHPQAAGRTQAARPAASRQQPAPRPGAPRPQGAPAGAYRPAQPAQGRGVRPALQTRPPAQKPEKSARWRIVFWAALVVLVVALAALGAIGFSYWQGQQSYNEVAEEGFTPPSDIEGTSLADLAVDWDALKAINPDTVGWIYIPGTPVNYPIVHTTDNEKYLTHDFKGSEGWIATFGAIFLAAENRGDFTDANNIIYGHHLNDGSMFACVAGFDDQATFDEHRTIYLLTPQGNYRLTTFSLVHVAADDPLAQTTFADDAERTAYMQDKIDRSVVEASDIPEAASLTQAFALATCDNLPSDGRYVLYASIADSTVGAAAEEGGQGDVADPDAVDAVDEAAGEIVS